MAQNTNNKYDVAIIGSGIGGSTLGAILARNGMKVVIFEGGVHPKFAVGESMILETSETMRAIAEFFDVPEVAYFSSENYFSYIGTSHGVKRHFSYLHHTPGQEHDLSKTLQAVIPKEPHGHEMHLYRQDSDYYLTAIAVAYGATVLQNTPVRDINVGPDGVEVITAEGRRFEADYVVDAGGFRSILADKFDLRDFDLRTHARSIFTHMINVPCYNDIGASRQTYGLPFRLSEGTLHHIFEGGWLWVIPFNNHPQSTNPLCSVGLQLDPRLYPQRDDLSPEEEFFDFIQRFPSVRAQFKEAKAVRNWVRTGRLQYSSKRIVGERFCLLGHAAGFIDPLFSKGLYNTMMSVAVLSHLLLEAHQSGDYSAAHFRPLEETTLSFVRTNDRLIANSYKSFANYKLWSVYAVLWLLGAYTELVRLNSIRAQAKDRQEYFLLTRGLKLAGGGFAEFELLADKIDTIIETVNPANETEVDQAVAEIKALFGAIDWMPIPFREVLAGKNHLPANKLKLRLFKPQGGFMGKGAYRAHFFGNHSMAALVRVFLREKFKYSTLSLRLRRKVTRAATGKIASYS
ncbi:MAG: NAD(P)/FAD-dependent oxidoreductase [Anaerolineae bacterium]|nr:NAD(P)/FAD-dependent oxidoreductase [Anaerolineae bacterium]